MPGNVAPISICAHCAQIRVMGPLTPSAPQTMGTCSDCGGVTSVAPMQHWAADSGFGAPQQPDPKDFDGDGL